MEQLTFSQVKKGNLTFKSIGTPTGVQGQTPIFSLTKDGETVKYSTDGVNYEILGGGGALIFNNVAVAVADFVTDTTYADYPYRAAIALTGVALTMIANVVFDVADATSGNYAPISDTYAGGTYIYAKEVPAAAITIPTIYVLSEAASGGASGNTWTNRGLWVANVQYNSYDIVYDNAGCYLCVADIASTTAPESDTANWSAIYKTVAQVQADWNEADTTSKAFIQNKPTIPSAVTVDQTYSSSSANAQSGKAVAQAVNGAVTVVANSFSLEASYPYVTPSFSPAAAGSCYYAYRNAAGALTSTDIVNATPVECSGNGEYTFYFYRATEYTVKVANEDESESFTHTFVGTGVVKVYRLETSACPQTYIEFINM